MRGPLLEALVRAQSRRWDRDAGGLSLPAYALGAAVLGFRWYWGFERNRRMVGAESSAPDP